MSRTFYSIPGCSVTNSTDELAAEPVAEKVKRHPKAVGFYEARRRRGDNARAAIPAGTSINIDGQRGVVESEESSHNGDVVTYIRGERSGTRKVTWGQDAPGVLTIKESKRIFE